MNIEHLREIPTASPAAGR